MFLESELLSSFPPDTPVSAAAVRKAIDAGGTKAEPVLVVLDDDPTGTQSVADLPVLTTWTVEDFAWAFAMDGPAVYVLTNTRSLDPQEAFERNRQVVRNARVAAGESRAVTFVSRSDSTLRGHFPLEPDAIAGTLANDFDEQIDGVVIVPAFPEAGRITIGGVHYMRQDHGTVVPVSETEFAQDATFGFTHSELARYVEEKSGGRIPAASVIGIDLSVLRQPDEQRTAHAVAAILDRAHDGSIIVADCVSENDLRRLALGLEAAEARGKRFIYRVGPPFVRGRIGQEMRAPLSADDVFGALEPRDRGGLIVVGSHVGLTSRQLAELTRQHPAATVIEIDVQILLAGGRGAYLDQAVGEVTAALTAGDVVLHTSRQLVRADDAAASLRIARSVSDALVEVVNRTLKTYAPRFVIAKGGITSSDVATHGLEIRRALVRGPMLPGIVSLWEPVQGPAQGIPYVVFAGNVGDDSSLAAVTRTLSSRFETTVPTRNAR
ncbi:hypothetical protein FDK12_05835 [Arthrobacter sp. NamB2]|uniref:four-carbon acid sugar kinase family protein n=1 Tax=Arthrobacter sp. NamB2 TaxID=2576035 RepID=UPI0010C9CA25|nr:four-carbon acid sugar kinase family protein [Arthrobacter sp. NamB2]TKV29163.1 hypothetical protein FDK12_05835 [Arthrobacter sp. NamB2]